MAAQDPGLVARLQRQGFAAIQPEQGLALLSALLHGPMSGSSIRASTIASPLLWSNLLQSNSHRARDPLYAEFAGPSEEKSAVRLGNPVAALDSKAVIEASLLAIICEVVGKEVSITQEFMEVSLSVILPVKCGWKRGS